MVPGTDRNQDDRAARVPWLPGAIVLAVLACFWPALDAEFVDWDDDLNLTDNAAYRGLGPAHLGWMLRTTLGGHYQPLTWLTFGLDHALWGMDAGGYHLTNVLLHAANAVLVFLLARALVARALGPGCAPVLPPAAAIGALLFAVHPLRVESVAWVSERRDVLSGLFYLATILTYLRLQGATGRRRAGWLAASLACFVLSLLAKAWGMTLPLVLLVLDAYPLGRLGRGRWRAALAEKAPYAAPALAAAVMAFLAQRSVEEMRSLAEHGLAARVAQAAYGLCFYLGKTLLPLGLSPVYLLEPDLDPTAPRYLASMAAVAGVTLAAIAFRRRRPWLLAAWAVYVVTVSPVLGIAQTGPQLVADRYTYLACIPWALVAAGAVARLARRPRHALAVAGVALAVLGPLTVRQTAVWRDSRTLWTHAIRLDPASYLAYTNRGWAADDPAAALADYDDALRLNPRYFLAYFNRGGVRHERGDFAGAIADYTAAIALLPRDPRAYNNRGWARQAAGDWAGAVADYERALALAAPGWPRRALVEGNLAAAHARLEAGER